jgi:CheY-like chemotaxis protein
MPISPQFVSDKEKSSLQGVQVLLTDDDETSRDLVEVILAHSGAVVRAVGSAAEALAAIGQWRPDVLVSDISMPQEDGYALIRKLGALDGPAGQIPALAFTALTGTENRQRALAAGFQMHLSKPADPFELVTLVARLVGVALPC